MQCTIDIRLVEALRDMSFFVPDYQRGYRWTADEARALLEDVWEFDTGNGALQYCVQPLIVQHRGDGTFEVVDGQQRLTTLYLFLKMVQEMMPRVAPHFSIAYQTRPGSADFLRLLPHDQCETNIDYHFMDGAYQAMWAWVREKAAAGAGSEDTIITDLNSKFKKSVFFIWYELPPDVNPIEMFSRVNIGKIPLTNAELIKALLLNAGNFGAAESRRQTEISVLWDKMEQALHREPFWYFLNEKDGSGTRIDMLFGLLAEQYGKRFPNLDKNEPRHVFRVLYEMFRQGDARACVEQIWKDAETLYEELRSWYEDYNKYHLIGYCIAQGESVLSIRSRMAGKTRRQAMRDLVAWIRAKYGETKTEELGYEQGKKVRDTLLLFNLATLLCEGDRQTRFPFDLYKKGLWDIEHIHATADKTAEPDNSIGNLTLLNARINRSYKDAPFAEKRREILEEAARGNFIPVCTKNVFLKSFAPEVKRLDQWDETDKAQYVKKIKAVLQRFFEGGWIQKEETP